MYVNMSVYLFTESKCAQSTLKKDIRKDICESKEMASGWSSKLII